MRVLAQGHAFLFLWNQDLNPGSLVNCAVTHFLMLYLMTEALKNFVKAHANVESINFLLLLSSGKSLSNMGGRMENTDKQMKVTKKVKLADPIKIFLSK